jgi:tripartite-type tricarboxylate transporter receptor subunit TctC
MTTDGQGRLTRRRLLWGAAGAASLATMPAYGQAAWPAGRQLRMVVPFPPAGATDNIGRITATRLSEKWGVPIVVENRAGAGGNVGIEAVAQAPADGNTILIMSVGLAINQYLYPRIGYDPQNDFQPVILLALVPNIVVVGRNSRFQSVADIIAAARAAPGQVTYATAGVGTTIHLSGALFAQMIGARMEAVHYRGSAPALQDVIGGRVDVMFDNISSALPQVRGGTLRALGITVPRRSQFAPEIPPVSETVPGFDATSWFGFFMKRGTPAEVVRRLETDSRAVLAEAPVRERFAALGAEVSGAGPAEFASFVRGEQEKWGRIIREGNIRAE